MYCEEISVPLVQALKLTKVPLASGVMDDGQAVHVPSWNRVANSRRISGGWPSVRDPSM